MSNVIFFRIKSFGKIDLNHFCESVDIMNANNLEGISLKDYGDSFLSGTFWVKKRRKIKVFNLEQEQYVENLIEVIEVAEIRLELDRNLLVIVGTRHMAQRCITLLSGLLNNQLVIDERRIELPTLCQCIAQLTDIELVKAYLKDIVIADGIIVSCNVNLKNVESTAEFIAKYSKNLISIQLSEKKTNSTVTIKENGNITVGRMNVDDCDELIEFLNTLLEKEH